MKNKHITKCLNSSAIQSVLWNPLFVLDVIESYHNEYTLEEVAKSVPKKSFMNKRGIHISQIEESLIQCTTERGQKDQEMRMKTLYIKLKNEQHASNFILG